MKDLVKEKRRLFEVYLADRNDRNKKAYKRKNRQVNVAVREKKNAVYDRVSRFSRDPNYYSATKIRCSVVL